MNKILIVIALLIIIAVGLYFSQKRSKPQIESLEGLDTELETLIDK